MTLSIQYVPVDYAAQSWGQVEELVAKAIPYSNGDFTLEQLKLLVCTGQQLLLVAVDENNDVHGASTVLFVNGANDRTAIITTMGGKLITGSDEFSQMCRVLRQQGATKIHAYVRPSMARMLKKHGFDEVAALVEVKL